MNTLLRWLAERKAGRSGAQVIVFDGGAEVERTRSFLWGTALGAALTLGLFLLTAPTTTDARTVEELERRELLLRDANHRLRQALEVADICLTTAAQFEKTLLGYQALLRGSAAQAAE
jgi:Tfp pilus assembly protein PilN